MAYSVGVSAPKYIAIDRDQPSFGIVDVEELTGRFDFTLFAQDIGTRTHERDLRWLSADQKLRRVGQNLRRPDWYWIRLSYP
jgi:hypothetical protein